LARKTLLFDLANDMIKNNIFFILVQIDEAHSNLWPVGLENTPNPQSSFEDRLDRANNQMAIELQQYMDENKIIDEEFPFKLVVDGWNNIFAETFRAWPDVYHLIDSSMKVMAKSTYGKYADAVVDVDYVDLIKQLINKPNIN
jgi:hypothetical protein